MVALVISLSLIARSWPRPTIAASAATMASAVKMQIEVSRQRRNSLGPGRISS
jgi:hypothetical protein